MKYYLKNLKIILLEKSIKQADFSIQFKFVNWFFENSTEVTLRYFKNLIDYLLKEKKIEKNGVKYE